MCNPAFADASYDCFYGHNNVFIRWLKLFQQPQREQKSVRGDIDGTPEAIERLQSLTQQSGLELWLKLSGQRKLDLVFFGNSTTFVLSFQTENNHEVASSRSSSGADRGGQRTWTRFPLPGCWRSAAWLLDLSVLTCNCSDLFDTRVLELSPSGDRDLGRARRDLNSDTRDDVRRGAEGRRAREENGWVFEVSQLCQLFASRSDLTHVHDNLRKDSHEKVCLIGWFFSHFSDTYHWERPGMGHGVGEPRADRRPNEPVRRREGEQDPGVRRGRPAKH